MAHLIAERIDGGNANRYPSRLKHTFRIPKPCRFLVRFVGPVCVAKCAWLESRGIDVCGEKQEGKGVQWKFFLYVFITWLQKELENSEDRKNGATAPLSCSSNELEIC